VHQDGKLFASASKDESIVIWNCVQVREKSTQGGRSGGTLDNDDAIVQVLSEHEHVIDCIVWAPTEACRTIDGANYSGGNPDEENKEANEEINGEAQTEEENEGSEAQSAAQ
jgi:WD40 repeat protein